MEDYPMRLYVSVKYFVIHWPRRDSYLVLERNTHRIYSTNTFNFSGKGLSPDEILYIDIYFFLGVIPIETVLYIAVVTKVESKGQLLGKTIYEISEIELIEFNRSEDPKNLENSKTSIKKLLSSGFYFSFDYSLTLNIGYESQGGTLHDESDKRFYWNFELYKEFISQDIDTLWFVPIIQGFFSVFHGENVVLALLSRRSCERAGTRYNCRGIDESGNVANFVETEQILIVADNVFSYTQIRGSVPLYWGQSGITAQLSFTKSREMSITAFCHHADKLIEKYGHITMINLLSSSKAFESNLTNEWEAIFNKVFSNYSQHLTYTYFDFHSNCKGQKFHKINLLIERISNFLQYYCYYSSDGSKQQGVIRTNCLDCLDRTNVVQSSISWDVLMNMLRKVNMDYVIKQDASFVRAFKLQWADNGDYLSYQYTGTGSTISAVTREGSLGLKGLIMHGITSINRFYNATVHDDVKQTSIDAVLRKKNKTQIVNKIEEELNKCSQEYSQFIDIRIRVITWDLCGNKLGFINEITVSEDFCNIVIFAFQQVSEFGLYEDLLISAMAGYALLKTICIEDSALVVFVEDRLIEDVTMFDHDSVYLPYKGKITNKKALAVLFELYDSSFAFVACHLISGTDNNSARKEQIRYIHSQSFGSSEKLLEDFDCKVLFGNLNFRVNLCTFQILSHLNDENYEELFKTEQLTHNLKYGYLPGYKEPEITFPPTYPYMEGTEEYDRLKSRGPSWCDRVLYSGKLVPKIYKDLKITASSHRPVEAQFVLQVKKVNQDLKKETETRLYEELSPRPLGSLPKMTCAKDLICS